MRAVVLDEHGGTDVLRIKEVPDPVPGPEDIVVDVVATALNRADLLQRMGLYPGPTMEHEIPGLEFSGRVAAIGERVSRWTAGEAVMGIVGGGAYAEKIAVHERQVMRVPATVAVSDAAAIPEVWITAFDALVVQGGLTSGRRALVHAGASGVGTASIQIANAIGASVAVTVSGGKRDRCLGLGAALAVDYNAVDFVAAVLAWTDGFGVDVVLDVIGGDYIEKNIDSVRTGGRIILVGIMGGGVSTVNAGKLLMKRAALIGTTLRARPLEEKIAVTQRFAAEILPLFGTGAVKPVIDSRFPISEIAAAHDYMQSNANVGKIVIDVAE
ncbi:MAG: NAD(P)H-quinone oxidoreductase [Actinobacteria bacterium]|nr:NAD(P)H-quinone oxidoreductase [Actinomycetota bacterium]